MLLGFIQKNRSTSCEGRMTIPTCIHSHLQISIISVLHLSIYKMLSYISSAVDCEDAQQKGNGLINLMAYFVCKFMHPFKKQQFTLNIMTIKIQTSQIRKVDINNITAVTH